MLEKQLESLILDYLNRSGILAWKQHSEGLYDAKRDTYRSRGQFSIKGLSDIGGLLPDGKYLAIEVKRPGNKRGVTIEQLAFLHKVRKLSGHSLLVDSLEEVQSWNSARLNGMLTDLPALVPLK